MPWLVGVVWQMQGCIQGILPTPTGLPREAILTSGRAQERALRPSLFLLVSS